ncbi:hypothetical protein Ciccas_001031 [Cichlidogyrus casuarinus]|uniref:Uncharacterized protein n=1 Tax=Cichlidogyrus casuarinus TaxID=1844966 RepID=A0ABD2QL84_9PLAT
MGVLVGSGIGPICYALMWSKVQGFALITGAIVGSLAAMTSMLVYASTFPKGLNDFFINTSKVEVMLTANCLSVGLGAVLPFILTLIASIAKKKSKNSEDSDIHPWEITRGIDNPLKPWSEVLHDLELMVKQYKTLIIIAIVGSSLSICLFIFIYPGVGAGLGDFSLDGFKGWVCLFLALDFTSYLKIYFMFAYLLCILLITLIYPVAYELAKLIKNIGDNRIVPDHVQLAARFKLQTYYEEEDWYNIE